MIFHVGIDPCHSNVSYCNEFEKTIVMRINNNVNYNEIEKVSSLLEEIKSKINGKLAYACIYLFKLYGNEIRKKFIECGLKSGFKNVEIINWETTIYLNAMSQINYKPLKGNVIWIILDRCFFVWEINNQKAKFCGMWNADPSKSNELQKIVDESKLYKGPDVVLCNTKIDESNLRKISRCLFFCYDCGYQYSNKGSLLKARITAGDPDLIHLGTTYFLSRSISLKIGNNVITSFQNTQQLPIFYTKTIINNSKKDMLKIDTKSFDDDTSFELPEYSPIFLTFTIDRNEIFTVIFDISKTVETLFSYSIPEVQAPFNIGKNAIGIDLGTSRCCVSVIRKNGITTVPLDNTGERLLPSYVSYDEKNVKCGQIVVERLRNYSKSTIFDSKRIIGRSLSDIEIHIESNKLFFVQTWQNVSVVLREI